MAIFQPSFDNKRQNIRDIIPLKVPFHIGIEPTRYCNLKCFFCQHSTRGEFDDIFVKKGQELRHMNFDFFKKIIYDIMELPEQPKKIQFVGMGEPILNPELGKMIRHLRSSGFTGRIITYTNGVALTPQIADELVDSGLTSLQISVYGITKEDFETLAEVSIDIDKYIENIRYLFVHKKKLQIRLKTTDDVVTTETKRKLFLNMFNNICDQIFVEHIINIPNQMGRIKVKARNITQYSETLGNCREICPWMFYQSHINIDGDVFFCDILAKPKEYAIGNIRNSSFVAIWNGSARNELLCTGLKYGQNAITQCIDCDDRFSMTAPEEYLDDCREELLVRLRSQKGG